SASAAGPSHEQHSTRRWTALAGESICERLRTLHRGLYHWITRRHGAADCIRRGQESSSTNGQAARRTIQTASARTVPPQPAQTRIARERRQHHLHPMCIEDVLLVFPG